jgi:undecaprenyl-diphosphatase
MAVRRRLAALDRTVLLSGLVIAAGSAGLVALVLGIREGCTIGFDRGVLRALRASDDPSIPVGPYWLAEAARDITALGSEAVLGLLTLGSAVLLAADRRWRAASFLLVAILGGELLSQGLKFWIDRPRPDVVPPLVKALGKSFPSGHAMLSMVTYLTLAVLASRLVSGRRAKACLLGSAVALTLLVGSTRVYLGVHYPTDVLGGWIAGLVWATVPFISDRTPGHGDGAGGKGPRGEEGGGRGSR